MSQFIEIASEFNFDPLMECTPWGGQLRYRESDYLGRAFKEKAHAETQKLQH